jgi:GDP-L-fucose synthase
MRILLTGATGMVGQNLLEHPDAKTHVWLTPGRDKVDLRDRDQVRDYLAAEKPDFVIHAAGVVGGIQANIREPVRFLLDNLDIGRNVIAESRRVGVTKLLNLSCSCVYPRNAPNPLQESSLLQGEFEPTNEGYALARMTALKLCEAIVKEDPSFAYKTLVASNLYGRFDSFDPSNSHMVPAVIAKVHAARVADVAEVDIWGDGLARREFMLAGDLADCVLRAVERFDELPALANVGTGEDHDINTFYAEIAAIVGFKGRFVHDLTKPSGMARKLLDVSRIADWGWRAPTSLSDGLRQSYAFYQHDILNENIT